MLDQTGETRKRAMTDESHPREPQPIDSEIRAACAAGDHEGATTLLLQTYAEELLSFLVARLRDRSHADEAFCMLAEDLWAGLPKFEFRSSVRTWAYTLARHVAARYARAPEQRKQRHLTLSRHGRLSQLVQDVRTRTQAYQRTDVKNQVRALREKLDPDDQMLLILRVDRQLSWRDLALVMGASPEEALGSQPDEATIEREAARLRKRFERVKAELKQLAKQAGLLE